MVIKRSIFGLEAAAFFTASKILVTIESSNNLSTCAFVIGDFAEAVGVMLFYQIGELFQSTVDCPYSFVTLIFITPVKFIVPLNTSSPFSTLLGNVSPVNAFVSREVLPSVT